MNSRLNLFAVGGFLIALVVVLIFASKPQNVRRVQAGFLGIISPFLKSGSEVDRKVKAFRKGMETITQLEAEVADL